MGIFWTPWTTQTTPASAIRPAKLASCVRVLLQLRLCGFMAMRWLPFLHGVPHDSLNGFIPFHKEYIIYLTTSGSQKWLKIDNYNHIALVCYALMGLNHHDPRMSCLSQRKRHPCWWECGPFRAHRPEDLDLRSPRTKQKPGLEWTKTEMNWDWMGFSTILTCI